MEISSSATKSGRATQQHGIVPNVVMKKLATIHGNSTGKEWSADITITHSHQDNKGNLLGGQTTKMQVFLILTIY